MSRDIEFERWFGNYFGNAQGEDSPYQYSDVKLAFYEGWKRGKEWKKEESNQ